MNRRALFGVAIVLFAAVATSIYEMRSKVARNVIEVPVPVKRLRNQAEAAMNDSTKYRAATAMTHFGEALFTFADTGDMSETDRTDLILVAREIRILGVVVDIADGDYPSDADYARWQELLRVYKLVIEGMTYELAVQ